MNTPDSDYPRIETALTDLQLITVPDADFPGRNHVYLRNNNSAKSIVANLLVAGTDNFEITSLSRLQTRNYYPQDFEVRIPPGGQQFVGRDRTIKMDIFRFGGGHTERTIFSTYTVSGARYVADEAEPLPPPPNDANNCIFMYRAPIDGESTRGVLYAANVNHLFGVEFSAKPISGGNNSAWFSAAIAPTYQLLFYDSWSQSDAWEIYKARYFEHSPSVLFEKLELRANRNL